jgi:hypothetical protein
MFALQSNYLKDAWAAPQFSLAETGSQMSKSCPKEKYIPYPKVSFVIK